MMHEYLLKYKNGIQIREDIPILFLNTSEVFFKSRKPFTLKNLKNCDIEYIKNLQKGITNLNLAKIADDSRKKKILQALEENNALKHFFRTKQKVSSLDRQLDWLSYFAHCPKSIQRKIANKRILILGCGGTGSVIAMHLARAGFEKLVLLDDGKIDLPDLNRQLTYHYSDLGKFKTTALRNYLIKKCQVIDVKLFKRRISSVKDILKILNNVKVDFVINCADQPIATICAWVAEACLEKKIPVVFGGVGLDESIIGPLLTTDSAKNEYIIELRKTGNTLKNHKIMTGSICFTNSVTAIMIAFDVFKFITNIAEPISLNKTLQQDFFSGTLDVLKHWGKS